MAGESELVAGQAALASRNLASDGIRTLTLRVVR